MKEVRVKMQPQAIKQGQKWVIARNFRRIGGGLISGTHNHSTHETRLVYDVWTGKEWYGQCGFAKFFTTEEEASQYLEENRERLQD